MTKISPPKVIDHKVAVRYVQSLLKEHIPGLEEVYDVDAGGRQSLDLTRRSEKHGIETAIIVFDHFTLDKKGMIRSYTKMKLGDCSYSLICTNAR